MENQSLKELSLALHNGTISSVELTHYYLHRIQENKYLNAFITINEEQALKTAREADNTLRQGRGKALTGIPMAHKDIFCTTVLPTTCASKMLLNFHSPYDATIVKKLAENETILLGKTNMDEFAMGSSNETSYFGPVRNPWDRKRVPGGSSGGSAAAVAADLVPFATGSDTGGSIRQPAAFCGISGLKPTYGLVSRFGMVAFASSLDQAGPLARRVEDLAVILQAMAGFDEKDSTSVNHLLPDYLAGLNTPHRPLRIGLPHSFFKKEVDSEVKKAVMAAVDVFLKAGAEVIEVDLRLQPFWVPCYYVIACAEASSNLSRFDGIRFGHRVDGAKNLVELITHSRDEGFGLEVKRRILTGTYVLSSGYFDDYYVQAQKVRRMIQVELQQLLTEVDVILGPTTPTCAFLLDEKDQDPTKRYLADEFTVAANLAGLPALSVPVGFNHEGLPIGMQLMSAPFGEEKLLQLGHYYQQQTSWHLKKADTKDKL